MSRTHFPRLALALTTLLVATGCDAAPTGTGADDMASSDTGEVDTAEDGSSSGTSGADDSAGAAPSLLLECGLEPACEVAPLAADDAAKAFADTDLLCVLAALGEGRLGLVQTAAAFDGSVANLDFALLGDGEVLRQAYGESPGVGEWINAPMRCTLQTPDFFAACASEFTPACADPESWIVSCRPVDAFTCPSP